MADLVVGDDDDDLVFALFGRAGLRDRGFVVLREVDPLGDKEPPGRFAFQPDVEVKAVHASGKGIPFRQR